MIQSNLSSLSSLSPTAQAAATETILDIDLNVQAQKGPDLRKDHPKSHGLVWGEFNVEDNLPEALKVGIDVENSLSCRCLSSRGKTRKIRLNHGFTPL